MKFSEAWSRAGSTERTILSPFTKEYLYLENQLLKSRSRAVSAERAILSPFTKEYLVLATYSGIRLVLEAYFLFRNGPSSFSSICSFDSDPLLAANTVSLLEISDNVLICCPVTSTVFTLLNK
ncbi:hypothetical protein E1A91_D10G250100v1 [Gossypium mustelinum]|uniref:Uncharacterized protein n=1 Tax=Gossypium mustelinum TaxID=34275 RepID=A0A5D2TE66_GOSMU|nr:hypothetical protein E1A91_D10G250100v1 [Gossypium mustelinum]